MTNGDAERAYAHSVEEERKPSIPSIAVLPHEKDEEEDKKDEENMQEVHEQDTQRKHEQEVFDIYASDTIR